MRECAAALFPHFRFTTPRRTMRKERGVAHVREGCSLANLPTPPMSGLTYRGWTIRPRTFQIRGTLEWTQDLVIAYRTKRRTFSGPKKFRTEQEAIRGCHAYGRRIIDGLVPYCTVEDLR